jgi:hypothetical protein
VRRPITDVDLADWQAMHIAGSSIRAIAIHAERDKNVILAAFRRAGIVIQRHAQTGQSPWIVGFCNECGDDKPLNPRTGWCKTCSSEFPSAHVGTIRG